ATRKHIEATLKQAEEGRALEMAIWHDGCIIGVTAFNAIDRPNRIGQIGYWIGSAHQGKGLMLSSVRALMDHGFRELGLNRQVISAAVEKTRSRALPERRGFK